ncbi:hypothetical protein Clacol_003662 [Clathrus columnatus]|uniref:RRP15-like protein n=1 Tax=Clathrus columnatus TaxID=1419009 RepID=A0AAV5A909_9AGAM|nr:hypothetical protein Clacol_003662 [Clathrus columnatus]
MSSPSAQDESSSASDFKADSDDTEEINQAQLVKSRKTLKRKRRATSPSRFGQTLEALLETNAPLGTNTILALKPSIGRRQKEEKLEKGARKLLEGEKRDREEKGRIKDVIGGWGMEGERSLRKVAQRGVITLFNAIQQSQTAAGVATENLKMDRGTGKPRLPAPDPEKNDKISKKKKLNIIGRGKEEKLDSNSFIEMIRAGGVVSKS